MTAREKWTQYVTENGGPTGVANKLGIPYSTIAGVCNGSRGIGRQLAARMAQADDSLDASWLVWVEPTAQLQNAS